MPLARLLLLSRTFYILILSEYCLIGTHDQAIVRCQKMINRGPLCKVQYSDRVSEIAQARGPHSLALRPQGLLAGIMRYFRAKVNCNSRRALSLSKQTFVRKYHIVPASRPWVHSPRMKGPTLHPSQQPNLIIYIFM